MTSIEQMKKGAKNGDVTSLCHLAAAYYNGEGVAKDHKEAFKLFATAAKKGSGWGNHMCGVMAQTGQGIEVSASKATKYYTAAVRTGNAASAFNLAAIYEADRDSKKKIDKAKELYEFASELGHAKAMINRAGIALREAPADLLTAIDYYGKAYAHGDHGAADHIADVAASLGILNPLRAKFEKTS